MSGLFFVSHNIRLWSPGRRFCGPQYFSFQSKEKFLAPDSTVFLGRKTCFRLHKMPADKAVHLLSAFCDPTGSRTRLPRLKILCPN